MYSAATGHKTNRSSQMYVMQEALAREHMRQREYQARQSRLSAELASAQFWQYLAERARVAATRHTQRASQALVQP
jgi:hypothetical protein